MSEWMSTTDNKGGWSSTDQSMNCIECGYVLSGYESSHLHNECYLDYFRHQED